MVKLKYKSLVTKETINYYLSIIKDDEKQKKDLLSIISKFDIRISTKSIIEHRENKLYYKIWIWRRGTKKRAHMKQYYQSYMNDRKSNLPESSFLPLTLSDILKMIKTNADVSDDFEEYCEIRFKDPSDKLCRNEYLDDLRIAKRFKKFITQEEIKSFPDIIDERNITNRIDNEEKLIKDVGYEEESRLKRLGYSIIFLNDKREYDKLEELHTTLAYYVEIVEYYGYNIYTGELNTKLFPITKEDKQMEDIDNYFKKYFKVDSDFYDYIRELIKKYNIKPTGNLSKRLAFSIKNDNNNNNTNSKQQQIFSFILAAVDLRDFS